ncbi:MAG: arginine--tRNA ligase [Candidatus Marinimicrobia bacterium]|nr:arginine--tRNA ligase [Candidatus Neomarinimicrobiota bacterium]
MLTIKSSIYLSIKKVLNNLSFPVKDFSIIPPKIPEFGDLSSNIALLLAKDLNKSPMDIGQIIIKELNNYPNDYIVDISLTKPGFINFKIDNQFFQNQLLEILEKNDNYGKGIIGEGKKANVEFVSANPTGPLTVGHGRNAIIGDTISNILEWQGFDVVREYYFNDAGRQMRILAKSVEARYFELLGQNLQLPEDGYQGDYIIDIAQSLLNEKGSELKPGSKWFQSKSEEIIFHDIKESLLKLGINFDEFVNEKTFYDNGDIDQLISDLKEKDLIYEKENAVWFKTSSFGDAKDRVYIKSSGEPTYRVPDTAYHRYKIKRGYDLIIDVFGADHADAYPDVINALNALGHKTNHIKVLIYQFVTLLRSGKKIKMSTRKGDFVTLDKLVSEVGVDIVRYFFIMRSVNSHLDFDLDLATEYSDKNPVYYLQYAHARLCNILARGNNLEYDITTGFNLKLLKHENEILLLKYMSIFPEYAENAYLNLEPQIITNFLQEFSARFHKFYNNCRVITDDVELTKARIALVRASKIVLKNGFRILGISAPERM